MLISTVTDAAGSTTPNMNVVTGCDSPMQIREKNPIFFSVFSMARIIPKILSAWMLELLPLLTFRTVIAPALRHRLFGDLLEADEL